MTISSADSSQLSQLRPDKIVRNGDNPRLFFRDDEMDKLMSSVKKYGIQVPITVYREKDHFVLIDGERRWRCAQKLNFKSIPALVQKKPSPLENLLLMFNIHALREQWDYFTIANKLPVVKERFVAERGTEPSEIDLSDATGLTRGQIRRCLYLLELPDKYKGLLVEELSLPKRKQKLSEDFFIEMERSLRTVRNRIPSAISSPNKVRDALISKFRRGAIKNITDFRMLSKIATAVDNLDIKEASARASLNSIFDPTNDLGIEEIYVEHFGLRYDQRKLSHNVRSLIEYLDSRPIGSASLEPDLRTLLAKLSKLIRKVLGDD